MLQRRNSVYEDDPRAENWDKHGRYYSKIRGNVYSRCSSLDVVIDYANTQGIDSNYVSYKKNLKERNRKAREYYRLHREKILLKHKLKNQQNKKESKQ
jgi:hypothetical protein